MENKNHHLPINTEEKARWDKAIAEQQEIASNPRSQREAEEFAKQISHISLLESLRQFTI